MRGDCRNGRTDRFGDARLRFTIAIAVITAQYSRERFSARRYQLYDAPAPHVVAAFRLAPARSFRFAPMRIDAPSATAW